MATLRQITLFDDTAGTVGIIHATRLPGLDKLGWDIICDWCDDGAGDGLDDLSPVATLDDAFALFLSHLCGFHPELTIPSMR